VCVQGKVEFAVDLNLGTGHNASARVSHATLINRLADISDSTHFTLQGLTPSLLARVDKGLVTDAQRTTTLVVQRSGLFGRNRRLLFEVPVRPAVLKNAFHTQGYRSARLV
jgi:hypothetical protein